MQILWIQINEHADADRYDDDDDIHYEVKQRGTYMMTFARQGNPPCMFHKPIIVMIICWRCTEVLIKQCKARRIMRQHKYFISWNEALLFAIRTTPFCNCMVALISLYVKFIRIVLWIFAENLRLHFNPFGITLHRVVSSQLSFCVLIFVCLSVNLFRAALIHSSSFNFSFVTVNAAHSQDKHTRSFLLNFFYRRCFLFVSSLLFFLLLIHRGASFHLIIVFALFWNSNHKFSPFSFSFAIQCLQHSLYICCNIPRLQTMLL